MIQSLIFFSNNLTNVAYKSNIFYNNLILDLSVVNNFMQSNVDNDIHNNNMIDLIMRIVTNLWSLMQHHS